MTDFVPVWWDDGRIGFIDQRRLPSDVVRRHAENIDEVVAAITALAVRGAPSIGIFGGYGVALARQCYTDDASFRSAAAKIRGARPTAVNLGWAVDRVLAAGDGNHLATAHAIEREQRAVDRAIALHGATLIPHGAAILTHCNTGPLATGATGTALGAIIEAQRLGKNVRVFVGETRPLLQGARLTMTELRAAGVSATLLVDSAAAMVLQQKRIDCVLVGADRIACNGDTANKIGTYGLAIAAAHHGIPFYVAAPRSTIDFALERGDGIIIEERDPSEVRAVGDVPTAPPDCDVFNPAFDVTPGHLIGAIVTEYGIARTPYAESLPDLSSRPSFSVLGAAVGR